MAMADGVDEADRRREHLLGLIPAAKSANLRERAEALGKIGAIIGAAEPEEAERYINMIGGAEGIWNGSA